MAKAVAPDIVGPPPKTGGDDLDDGLDLDAELIADESSDEDDGPAVRLPEDGDEDGDVFVEEEDEEEERTPPEVVAGVKRKAGETEDEEARKAEKKRRKKEKEKARKAKRLANAPTTSHSNPSSMSPEALSAALLASIRESYPSATPMEIEDLLPSSSTFLAPLDAEEGDEAEGSFAPLQRRIKFILAKVPKLKVSMPRVIILALSGLRCADVVRGVRDVRGDGQVAKLFAKHMKYPEQVSFLGKTKCSIAVGTPARIGKLIAEEGIKVNEHTVLLLEIGHRDSKTRTLLTLPEVRDELWKSVFSGPARVKIVKGGVKIGAC